MTRRGRRSLGGGVVEAGLSAVGFDLQQSSVALIETASPRVRGFEVLLAQSAWNFLDEGSFEELAKPYPLTMVKRMRARRAVSGFNARRARRLVCLTEYMAELVASRIKRAVEVASITYPIDLQRRPPHPDHHRLDFCAVVPGTVTWYKRPTLALDWLAANIPREQRACIHFAGNMDSSGAAEDLQRHARSLGLEVALGAMTRESLYGLMGSADVVLVPSELESLGFALSEALALAPRVIASPIPPHREIARRVGREPEWFGGILSRRSSVPSALPDWTERKREWRALGQKLDPINTHAPAARTRRLPR